MAFLVVSNGAYFATLILFTNNIIVAVLRRHLEHIKRSFRNTSDVIMLLFHSCSFPLVNDLKAALSLSPEDFKAKYQRSLPKKDDCNLVFHCKSGGRSLKAVTMARQMGWFW